MSGSEIILVALGVALGYYAVTHWMTARSAV